MHIYNPGRGFIHKIVEMFEAPQEDEFLESQMMSPLISLVSAGANINLRDTDGNTPLHLAFILNSGSKVCVLYPNFVGFWYVEAIESFVNMKEAIGLIIVQ